ncbi:hypothetical protein HDV00_008877 [Rhizophlyctis rosea]|nr:hypothetical protein HDV00_008877 [Rhizophlyctis rosea]
MKFQLAFVPAFLGLLQGVFAGSRPRCQPGADPRPLLDTVVYEFQETATLLDETVDSIDSILGKLNGNKNQLVLQKNNVTVLADALWSTNGKCRVLDQTFANLDESVFPCVLSYIYLQPYPTLLAQLQTLDSTYTVPEHNLIQAARSVINDLNNNYNSDNITDLTVQAFKNTLNTARQSLVAARKLNNKAVNLAQSTVDKINDKLKTVTVTLITAQKPSPTPYVEICVPNASIRPTCNNCDLDARCDLIGLPVTWSCEAWPECVPQCVCDEGYYQDVYADHADFVDVGNGNIAPPCVPAAQCHPFPTPTPVAA